MSLRIFISAAAFCAIALAALDTSAADADELESVRKTVSDMFEVIDPEDVRAGPIDGWYTIQKGSIVAYISADSRYLFQGDLIDLDSQVNMTEAARNDTRRDLISSVSDEQTILFSPSEVKHSITVFTDVDCSYCRRLHAQIDEYMAHGIEVRYLLYPRNGPTSAAWTTSEQVWCAADRANALTQAKLDKNFNTSKCDASAVQEHFVIGRDVGLSGTPAIVLEDGTLIAGYMPPDQLKARLDQAAARP
jgi:thiol:disulfide interchange protein DsbC